eukprot:CAMPEP_0195306194 /NCGR_PEP_ID=MMETSP0707-20130614/37076_1 /TAXON_ID=33640 /ORGANISM="Asterionellopsis glacialis, Strain CCMP134" /LENGTH=396 /DNA_ID=CAMNT_0040370405 /DNA_START=248 /DNA_END=1438 /DNA_ORIENTATION=+
MEAPPVPVPPPPQEVVAPPPQQQQEAVPVPVAAPPPQPVAPPPLQSPQPVVTAVAPPPPPPPQTPNAENRVILPTPEEFAPDENLRLGRANGNVYQRKPGVDGVHDGQIMVRLKKKRFIVVDYSLAPEDAPETAVMPEGAGKQKCITPECTKVGIPICLFDSEPSEPASLYMRSGLCFTCQRILNEKRRTQRKRKTDDGSDGTPHSKKKAKLASGEIIDLAPDAVIVNGPVGDAKPHGEAYGFHEIGVDLQTCVQEAAQDTERLVTASEDITALYDKASGSVKKSLYLLSQWKGSWDAAIAAAVAQETVNDAGLADAVASAAAVVAAAGLESQENSANMIALLSAAEAKGDNGEVKKDDDTGAAPEAVGGEAPPPPPPPPEGQPGENNENVEVFGV